VNKQLKILALGKSHKNKDLGGSADAFGKEAWSGNTQTIAEYSHSKYFGSKVRSHCPRALTYQQPFH